MGKIFGVGSYKAASTFPSLDKPLSFKAPVKKLANYLTSKGHIKNDTFTKTTVLAKKIYKPSGR